MIGGVDTGAGGESSYPGIVGPFWYWSPAPGYVEAGIAYPLIIVG